MLYNFQHMIIKFHIILKVKLLRDKHVKSLKQKFNHILFKDTDYNNIYLKI